MGSSTTTNRTENHNTNINLNNTINKIKGGTSVYNNTQTTLTHICGNQLLGGKDDVSWSVNLGRQVFDTRALMNLENVGDVPCPTEMLMDLSQIQHSNFMERLKATAEYKAAVINAKAKRDIAAVQEHAIEAEHQIAKEAHAASLAEAEKLSSSAMKFMTFEHNYENWMKQHQFGY